MLKQGFLVPFYIVGKINLMFNNNQIDSLCKPDSVCMCGGIFLLVFKPVQGLF